jgi:ferrous iron transport protein B
MNSQQERLRRPQGSPPVRVALLGMPNTGKSTLYNRLTGGHAQIANWPGLTVDLLQGPMAPNRNGRSYALVDLPGIHDLGGSSGSTRAQDPCRTELSGIPETIE